MQQRDMIKDEIEQLGRAIGKLISKFFGMKNEGDVAHAIEITNDALLSELDIDIDKLVLLEANQLNDYVDIRKLSALHLDQIASYLYEISIVEKSKDGAYKKWAVAAKSLLEIVGRKSDTITFGRIDLISKIDEVLK